MGFSVVEPTAVSGYLLRLLQRVTGGGAGQGGDHYCCAACFRSLPAASYPVKSGHREKWRLTHNRVVCLSCIDCHFGSSASVAASSPKVGAQEVVANVSPTNTPSLTSSATATPTWSAAVACDSPLVPPLGPGRISRPGMRAHEAKSLRLRTLKKELRASARLFVDVLHYLQDLLDRPDAPGSAVAGGVSVLVEDDAAPPLCRPHLWGLPCGGCAFEHWELRLTLWRGAGCGASSSASRSSRGAPWMRSPPYLPCLVELPLAEVSATFTATPEDRRAELGRSVQFLLFEGSVVWGRDLGADSERLLGAFVQHLSGSGGPDDEDFSLPPAAEMLGLRAWPVEVWRRVLGCLSLHDAVRCGTAMLAEAEVRSAACEAWDSALLPLPPCCSGQRLLPSDDGGGTAADASLARSFLEFARCARTVVLAAEVTAALDKQRRQPAGGAGAGASLGFPSAQQRSTAPERSGGTCARPSGYRRWPEVPPARSVPLPAEASCLALGEELLAVAVDMELRLIRRADLRGCGSLRSRRYRGLALPESGGLGTLLVASSPLRQAGLEILAHSTEEPQAPPASLRLPADDRPVDERRALTRLEFLSAAEAIVVTPWSMHHLDVEAGVVLSTRRHTDVDRREPWVAAQKAGSCAVVAAMPGGAVELWDLRSSCGLAAALQAPLDDGVEVSALAAACRAGPEGAAMPGLLVGDSLGRVHCLGDWRRRSIAAQVAAGPYIYPGADPFPVSFLAHEPGGGCIVCHEQGAAFLWAQASGQLVPLCPLPEGTCLQTAAAGPGGWALGLGAAGRRGGASLLLADFPGSETRPRAAEDPAEAAAPTSRAPKAPKAYRRTEGNAHGMHAQSAGKASRSGGGGRCSRTGAQARC